MVSVFPFIIIYCVIYDRARRFIKEESAATSLCHEDDFAWNMHLARHLRHAFSLPPLSPCNFSSLCFLSTAFHPRLEPPWRTPPERTRVWIFYISIVFRIPLRIRGARPRSYALVIPNLWIIFIERIQIIRVSLDSKLMKSTWRIPRNYRALHAKLFLYISREICDALMFQ